MTPDDILRDALGKITAQRQADQDRLSAICAEGKTLHARIAKADETESALAAILSANPLPTAAPVSGSMEGSTPSAGGEPVPAVEPEKDDVDPEAPPLRSSDLRPVEPEAAAAALATIAPPPALQPQPEPDAGLPGPADPMRDKAIQAAKTAGPSTRTERHVRILAAAGVVRAFHTQAAATAARFGVCGVDIAPSALRRIGVVEEDVAAVAKALNAKKAAADRTEQPKAPEPEAETAASAAEPSATTRELAEDLAQDLPSLLESCPDGAPISVITEWFGVTADEARAAVDFLVSEGRASVTSDYALKLPEKAAVSA